MEETGTVMAVRDGGGQVVDFLKMADDFEPSQEVQIIVKEAQEQIASLTQGKPFVIRNQHLEEESNRLVVILKEQLANIEAERKAAKEPILEAGRRLDAKAKVISVAIEAGKTTLDNALKEWDTFQTRQAKEAQDKINEENRKRQEAENKRADKKGVEPRNVTTQAVVQTPQKSTQVEVGGKTVTRTWVDNWKAKINGIPDEQPVNAEQAQALGIPLRFFYLDRGELTALAKKMKCDDPLPGSKVVGFNDRYQR